MPTYAEMDNVQLAALKEELEREYGEIKARGLALNMARGKPSAKQLELALGVLEALKARSEFANSNGDDCRNYGLWDGLPEMKRIFADMVGVPASQVILGNNSSLMMMFEVISRGFSHGYNGCTPWCKLDKKKFTLSGAWLRPPFCRNGVLRLRAHQHPDVCYRPGYGSHRKARQGR